MKTLETERLILKAYTLDDAQELYDYAKDPDVGPHAGWAPHKSVEESREIIRDLFLPSEAWTVRLKDEGKVIGTIALEKDRYHAADDCREIGYSLGKAYWGRGIMTEACREVMRFAFEELGCSQLGIVTGPENKRSQRIIEKCGFKYEGRLRRTYKIYDGSVRDSLIFSIMKDEYEALR